MNAKKFIKENLKYIFKKIEGISIRYEHISHINAHVIEITPINIFELDEEYMLLETAFEENFDKEFPSEELVFVSSDSLTKIKNAEFELKDLLPVINSEMVFYQAQHNKALIEANQYVNEVSGKSAHNGFNFNELFSVSLDNMGEDNYALAA